MSNKNEDNMVRLIEKNLSNNINNDLFLTGRIFESSKPTVNQSDPSGKNRANMHETSEQPEDYPLVVNDYVDVMSPSISRAEYIRQAREACLRQLSSSQIYSKPYESNYMLTDKQDQEQQTDRRAKPWKLFQETQSTEGAQEASQQELASFRFLIIRTVCAIILFLTIFIIDKFDLKIGDFTSARIQEYIVGRDTLQSLEDIVVTWLK